MFCHVYLYEEGEKTNFGSIFDRAMSVHKFPIDLYTLAIFDSDFLSPSSLGLPSQASGFGRSFSYIPSPFSGRC